MNAHTTFINLKLESMFKILTNVQILSALLWAAVILGCSYVTENILVSNILITAAGFHVVLLSHKLKTEAACKVS